MQAQAQVSVDFPADGWTVFRFSGELDETNADEIFRPVLLQAGASPLPVRFDLSRLEYVNSKAMGWMFEIHSALEARWSALVVVAVSDIVADAFGLVGAYEMFAFGEAGYGRPK